MSRTLSGNITVEFAPPNGRETNGPEPTAEATKTRVTRGSPDPAPSTTEGLQARKELHDATFRREQDRHATPLPTLSNAETPTKSTFLERWVARRLLRGVGDPGVRMVLPDGEEVATSSSPPTARIVVHDRATLWKLAVEPTLEFGEAYMDGRLQIEGNLLDLLVAVYGTTRERRNPRGWLRRLATDINLWLHSNTRDGSKRHIEHHYDIGNDFYKLWLDDQMVYTCAYFPTPDASLEDAQRAKLDHVCRKLWLRPGETVVEAGCGWGSLALHMAAHYGVSVRAFNISHEQIAYARRRAKELGLGQRVEFIEDDYRNITGQYDVFASVGMLEHVGRNHYHELGRTIDRTLSRNGRGLIHSIGHNCSGVPVSRWTQRRIFPGGYVPGLQEITALLEPWQFSVLDIENLRLHYAKTLLHWLARFDAAEDRVTRMFDSPFVRMWRLYLTGSAAAFLAGELQLFQVVFTRPQRNEIPWTRAGLYEEKG